MKRGCSGDGVLVQPKMDGGWVEIRTKHPLNKKGDYICG